MRIISGIYKGKIITAPENLSVRPTTDFAKTALFNILNNRIDYAKVTVLDLFAGTGNITYEFISRGCESITAVDENSNCIKFINHTLDKINFHNASVICSDVFDFIVNTNQHFDVIFADPPFEMKNIDRLSPLVFENKLLANNGLFILEHISKSDHSHQKYFSESRKYGKVSFSFFKQ